MIKCPCFIEPPAQLQNSHTRAHKGRKQPILHSSENTANCGHCGQFYAVKVSTSFRLRFSHIFCHLDLTTKLYFYRIRNTHMFQHLEESRSPHRPKSSKP
jgi:hypothetical protein